MTNIEAWSVAAHILSSPQSPGRFVGRARAHDKAFSDPEARAYFERVLNLEPNGKAQRTVRCPFHEDSRPSLSINLDSGLWDCKSGCGSGTRQEFAARLASTASPPPSNGKVSFRKLREQREAATQPEAIYHYVDTSGNILFSKVRNPGKQFVIGRFLDDKWLNGIGSESSRPLYNLPALLAATDIVFCEGEKDADNVQNILRKGWAATTNFDGADGKWRAEYEEPLRGKRVFVLPDNDEAGARHAEEFARAISAVAGRVYVVELPNLPEKGDVSDYLEAHSKKAFYQELQKAIPFTDPRDALFVTAEQFGKEAPQETPWLVEDLAAEKAMTQLIGKPKIGKSTFTHSLIRAVLEGKPFLEKRTVQSAIVYLTEMPETDLMAELKRDGLLQRSDLHILFWHRAMQLTWPAAVQLAIARCRKVGARLLIVDTLSRWARIQHENDASETFEALLPLDAALAGGLAVWIESHERKSGGDIADAGRGSGALTGAVSIVIQLRRPEGQHPPTFRQIEVAGRHQIFTLVINRTEEDYRVEGTRAAVAEEQAERRLRDTLPRTEEDAITLSELVEKSGVKRSTAQRVLKTWTKQNVVKTKGLGSRKQPKRYYFNVKPAKF